MVDNLAPLTPTEAAFSVEALSYLNPASLTAVKPELAAAFACTTEDMDRLLKSCRASRRPFDPRAAAEVTGYAEYFEALRHLRRRAKRLRFGVATTHDGVIELFEIAREARLLSEVRAAPTVAR